MSNLDLQTQQEELAVLGSIYSEDFQELEDGCVINLPIDVSTTIHNMHADTSKNKSKHCLMETLLVIKFVFPSNYPSSSLPAIHVSIAKCQPKNQRTTNSDSSKLSAIQKELTEKFSRCANDTVSSMNAGEIAVFNIIEEIRSFAAQLKYEYTNYVDLPQPSNLKKSAERSLWDEMVSRYTGFENISLHSCGTLIVFPTEIVLYIMSFLDFKGISSLAATCTMLHKFVVNESFWRVAYSHTFHNGDFWHQSLDNRSSSSVINWKERFVTAQKTAHSLKNIEKGKVNLYQLKKGPEEPEPVTYDLSQKNYFPRKPPPYSMSQARSSVKFCMDEDVILVSQNSVISIWDFKPKRFLLSRDVGATVLSMELCANDLLVASEKGLHVCDKWTAFPSLTIMPENKFWDAKWTTRFIVAVHEKGVLVLDKNTFKVVHEENVAATSQAIFVASDGICYHAYDQFINEINLQTKTAKRMLDLPHSYEYQQLIVKHRRQAIWTNGSTMLQFNKSYEYDKVIQHSDNVSCIQEVNNVLYKCGGSTSLNWNHNKQQKNAPSYWYFWPMLWSAVCKVTSEELPLPPLKSFRICDSGILCCTVLDEIYFMALQ